MQRYREKLTREFVLWRSGIEIAKFWSKQLKNNSRSEAMMQGKHRENAINSAISQIRIALCKHLSIVIRYGYIPSIIVVIVTFAIR